MTHTSDANTVKRYLPWVVAVALFMEQLDSTIINTAIPAMAESLRVTPLSLKAVVTSYILSLAVGIPISGWMAWAMAITCCPCATARCMPSPAFIAAIGPPTPTH